MGGGTDGRPKAVGVTESPVDRSSDFRLWNSRRTWGRIEGRLRLSEGSVTSLEG